jgi:hypothetical protein
MERNEYYWMSVIRYRLKPNAVPMISLPTGSSLTLLIISGLPWGELKLRDFLIESRGV